MKKIVLIFSIIILLSSCNCNDNKNSTVTMEQGNFAHVVYFWLNNPDNNSEKKAFEESLVRFINNSKYIKTKILGKPANTDRAVIDASYSYSLILTFENKEMQDKYQAEDLHLKFIEESEHLWEKVIVYDSVNILD